ncbi:unnamed protein product, partial [Gongylonema pulchrum]|uniref:Microtubule-associated protein 9 n=1 Tax=Gongylonema pulchrum TaxID=637853 RepID=A0A183CVR2_9BILA
KSGVTVERWQRESDDEEETSKSTNKYESEQESIVNLHELPTVESIYVESSDVINDKELLSSSNTAVRRTRRRYSIDRLEEKQTSAGLKKSGQVKTEEENAAREETFNTNAKHRLSRTSFSKVKETSSQMSVSSQRQSEETLSSGKAAYKVKEERKKEAKKNYDIWKERIDEATRERKRREKEEAEKLKKEKEEEKRRKNEEARKTFEVWKNDRLHRLMAERKERLQYEERERLKRKQESEAKYSEAQKAFTAWCPFRTAARDAGCWVRAPGVGTGGREGGWLGKVKEGNKDTSQEFEAKAVDTVKRRRK